MPGTKRAHTEVDPGEDDGGFLGPAPSKKADPKPSKKPRSDAPKKDFKKAFGSRGKGKFSKDKDKPKAYTRQERKDLAKERRAKRPFAAELDQAKKAWEKLRQKTVDTKTKHGIIAELLVLLKGKIYDTVTKHSASRIIQCMVKYGDAKQRTEIANALKGKVFELSKMPYASFLVMKLLKHGGSETRAWMLKEMYSHVRTMIKQKQASIVIEYTYAEIATTKQQSALIQEFYGPEFAYFKIGAAKSLKDLVSESDNKRNSILKFMGEVLAQLIEKKYLGLTIVHRVILEYLTYADPGEASDLLPGLLDSAVDLLHTREGLQVFVHAVASVGAKERKGVIKSLKGLVTKVANNEYGALALVALMSMVDDTVLMKKMLLPDVIENLSELIVDKSSQRVVMYPFAAENKTYFGPGVMSALTPKDGVNKFSKKDPAVRRRELLKPLAPPLLKACKSDVAELLVSPHGANALYEAVTCDLGEDNTDEQDQVRSAIIDTVAGDSAILESAIAVRILKNLIQPKKPTAVSTSDFGKRLLLALREQVEDLALKGSFVLVRLLDSDDTKAELSKLLKGVKKKLSQGECKKLPGCQLIVKLLA